MQFTNSSYFKNLSCKDSTSETMYFIVLPLIECPTYSYNIESTSGSISVDIVTLPPQAYVSYDVSSYVAERVKERNRNTLFEELERKLI